MTELFHTGLILLAGQPFARLRIIKTIILWTVVANTIGICLGLLLIKKMAIEKFILKYTKRTTGLKYCYGQRKIRTTGDKSHRKLPDKFLELLDNVDVVVEDYPTAEQLEIEEVEDETRCCSALRGHTADMRSSFYGMVVRTR